MRSAFHPHKQPIAAVPVSPTTIGDLPFELHVLVFDSLSDVVDCIRASACAWSLRAAARTSVETRGECVWAGVVARHRTGGGVTVRPSPLMPPVTVKWDAPLVVEDLRTEPGGMFSQIHILTSHIQVCGVSLSHAQSVLIKCSVRFQGRRFYDLTRLLAAAVVVVRVFGKEREIGSANAFVALSADREKRLPCYLAKSFEAIRMVPRFSLVRARHVSLVM